MWHKAENTGDYNNKMLLVSISYVIINMKKKKKIKNASVIRNVFFLHALFVSNSGIKSFHSFSKNLVPYRFINYSLNVADVLVLYSFIFFVFFRPLLPGSRCSKDNVKWVIYANTAKNKISNSLKTYIIT